MEQVLGRTQHCVKENKVVEDTRSATLNVDKAKKREKTSTWSVENEVVSKTKLATRLQIADEKKKKEKSPKRQMVSDARCP